MDPESLSLSLYIRASVCLCLPACLSVCLPVSRSPPLTWQARLHQVVVVVPAHAASAPRTYTPVHAQAHVCASSCANANANAFMRVCDCVCQCVCMHVCACACSAPDSELRDHAPVEGLLGPYPPPAPRPCSPTRPRAQH
eukprot:796509-Rhodomonas_salina.1